jgi:hypothetical protein
VLISWNSGGSVRRTEVTEVRAGVMQMNPVTFGDVCVENVSGDGPRSTERWDKGGCILFRLDLSS